MSYFSLRKGEPETEPEEVEEEQPEEAEDEPEKKPAKTYGPILTGLLGPGQWVAARFGTGSAWGIHGVAVWAIGFYGGWTAVGIVLAWLLAVGLFTPPETLDRAAGWLERRTAGRPEPVEEAAVEEAPDDPRAVLIRWLDDLTRGQSGIHLDELHQSLTRHPQLAHLKRAEMRAWLDRHQVAVDRTLRVGTVAGRSGVSRATVEALLGTPSPLAESGGNESPVHAPELHDSSVESGLERGGERAA